MQYRHQTGRLRPLFDKTARYRLDHVARPLRRKEPIIVVPDWYRSIMARRSQRGTWPAAAAIASRLLLLSPQSPSDRYDTPSH